MAKTFNDSDVHMHSSLWNLRDGQPDETVYYIDRRIRLDLIIQEQKDLKH